VDVFFVLSGFLITSIVVDDIREGSFSIREFYLRRIQRLLPNILVTVLTVLLLWTLLMPPSLAHQAGCHGLWTIFNLSNIYVWRNLGGYWGDAAEWAPLTHTWSLGVEEQFYLLFPSSLLLLTRLQPSRVRSWLIVGTMFSFGLCLYGTYIHPTATFYLLPTRFWELLLGASLAAYRTSLRSEDAQPMPALGAKAYEAIGWVGLSMIMASFFIINEASKFPGLVSLVPTVGTAFVLLSVTGGETRVSRLLSFPLMMRMGKLSYSLYLWHWPLITLGKIEADFHGMPQLAGSVAGGLAGILLAWGVYVVVEKPLRKRGAGRSWRLATIAAGFSIVALCCGVVAARQPVADPAHRFDTPAFYGNLFNAGRPNNNAATAIRYYDVYFPPLSPRHDDAWQTGGVVHLYGGGRPKIVVLGSSHALMYSRLIDDICREMGLSVAFLGVDQTPVFFDFEAGLNPNFSSPHEAHEFDEARKKWLREWHPEAVFVIDAWGWNNQHDFDVKLRSFLGEVSPLAGRVIFVAQVPVLEGGNQFNLRELITRRMSTENGLPRLEPNSGECARKQAVAVAEAARADFPNLRVLRADLPFYQEDGSIRYASGRTFFYADDNHLTDIGTEVVRGLFQSAIAEAHSGSSSP
jgi:peptidoglycan/LPS O-acetylase OafA/YrhL